MLIAEDNDDMRETVALALRAVGYEVGTVRDGEELVEWVDAALDYPDNMPDIIITDVVMPTLSGFGVLSALRRARMPTPVIVITGGDDSIRSFARRLGAVAVLKKPFELDDLVTAVGKAFAIR